MSSGSPSDQSRSGWDDSDPDNGGGFANIRYDDPDRAELEAEYDARPRAKFGDQAAEQMRRSLALSDNPRPLTDGEKEVLRRAVARCCVTWRPPGSPCRISGKRRIMSAARMLCAPGSGNLASAMGKVSRSGCTARRPTSSSIWLSSCRAGRGGASRSGAASVARLPGPSRRSHAHARYPRRGCRLVLPANRARDRRDRNACLTSMCRTGPGRGAVSRSAHRLVHDLECCGLWVA